jgi:glycosyltransferase involved in cell wall biosynthesis
VISVDSLDVVIPTYNRAHLIAGCLQSLIDARRPSDLNVRIFVVDNNSSDDTARIVRDIADRHPALVSYLFEPRQGRSAALNCGIRAGAGTLIGMIDDDERVDPAWLEVIVDSFRDPGLDFIGGPYVPIWCGARRPAWIPPHWQGVLGIDEDIPADCAPFTHEMHLFLRGGNAVVRRTLFAKVGLYSTELGRSATGLASCEDHDMFVRLLDAGARGLWVPRLIINHLIIPERLTKRYFRRWAFDHAVSLAKMDRRPVRDVKYVGRVPRYMIGATARTIARCFTGASKAQVFSAELACWDLAGFVYGAYLSGGKRAAKPAPR